MKKKIKFYSMLSFLLFAISAIAIFLYKKKQKNEYLYNLLRSTKSIMILNNYDFDNAIVIEDKRIISNLLKSTCFVRTETICACRGKVELWFNLSSGKTVSINYNDDPVQGYIKFRNPWRIQGIPSEEFRKIIKEILRKNGY